MVFPVFCKRLAVMGEEASAVWLIDFIPSPVPPGSSRAGGQVWCPEGTGSSDMGDSPTKTSWPPQAVFILL